LNRSLLVVAATPPFSLPDALRLLATPLMVNGPGRAAVEGSGARAWIATAVGGAMLLSCQCSDERERQRGGAGREPALAAPLNSVVGQSTKRPVVRPLKLNDGAQSAASPIALIESTPAA
jgi:hypothetical protein